MSKNLKIWAGLLTLYFVWGSTYIAIRFLVQLMPALFASSMRNLFAGGILVIFSLIVGSFKIPSWKDFWVNLLAGFLMITLGNAAFMAAAQYVPAGYSALFSALSPVVLVFIFWYFGEKPQLRVIFGAVLGIAGIMILSGLKNRAVHGQELNYTWAIILLAIGVLGWNFGTVLIKKYDLSKYSIAQRSGMQMFLGGLITLVASYFSNDFDKIIWQEISTNAYLFFGYLVLAGSVLGFWVFSWLNQNSHPTLVSTYTYVNPLVTIILGWLFANELVDFQMIIATGFIITAVVLITGARKNI